MVRVTGRPTGLRYVRFGLVVWSILALARVGSAQPFPAHDVTVDVDIDASGKATVKEQYALTAPPTRVELQYLSNRCASVSLRGAELGDRAFELDGVSRGPWMMLGGSSGAAQPSRATELVVRYDVDVHEGEASVPIVMPSAVLDRVQGTRGANVAIAVRFADGIDGAVLFPRFDRGADGVWRARLLAMPSALRVRAPVAAAGSGCAPEVPATTGGLEWRFWLFAGLMGLCVPVYLWVFARQKETNA